MILVATTLTTEQKPEIASRKKSRSTKISRDENAGHPEGLAISRDEIMEELKNFGVDTGVLNPLPTDDLAILLNNITNLVRANASQFQKKRGRPPFDNEHIVVTSVDRKILQYLFSSYGNFTSMMLSKKMGVPLSTIQRRRKRLEETLVEAGYSLKLDKLGWRTAMLSISVASVDVAELGKNFLEMSEMILSATRTIGESKVDLVLEVIFRTNSDLIALIELIKQKDGVRKVSWNESIELIGKSKNGYIKAINSSQ